MGTKPSCQYSYLTPCCETVPSWGVSTTCIHAAVVTSEITLIKSLTIDMHK